MIVEISSGPVRAVIVITDVMSVPEFVMNDFAPLMVQVPSRRAARVLVAPASDRLIDAADLFDGYAE
jgi:hypothetical protein